MDIRLRTHDPSRGLELHGIVPVEDGSSFQCRLRVTSEGYSADLPFQIERQCLEEFVEQLSEMDCTLTGSALLQPYCELDQVTFEVTRTGAVVVAGELGSLDFNYLKFRFTTDQTCLAPLISDIEHVLRKSSATV